MRTLALAACLALGGCQTLLGGVGLRPQPAPEQLSTRQGAQQATAVHLSGACKQKQVQHDYGRVVGMNARAAWKLTDHLLSVANGRIINSNACQDQEASEYARGLRAPEHQR